MRPPVIAILCLSVPNAQDGFLNRERSIFEIICENNVIFITEKGDSLLSTTQKKKLSLVG